MPLTTSNDNDQNMEGFKIGRLASPITESSLKFGKMSTVLGKSIVPKNTSLGKLVVWKDLNTGDSLLVPVYSYPIQPIVLPTELIEKYVEDFVGNHHMVEKKVNNMLELESKRQGHKDFKSALLNCVYKRHPENKQLEIIFT